MQGKDHLQIAKMLYAMEQKRKKPDTLETMKNERYQRTFTDEYLFRRKPRAREPVEPDPSWKLLAERKW